MTWWLATLQSKEACVGSLHCHNMIRPQHACRVVTFLWIVFLEKPHFCWGIVYAIYVVYKQWPDILGLLSRVLVKCTFSVETIWKHHWYFPMQILVMVWSKRPILTIIILPLSFCKALVMVLLGCFVRALSFMGFALKWVGDTVLGTWEHFIGQSVALSVLLKEQSTSLVFK